MSGRRGGRVWLGVGVLATALLAIAPAPLVRAAQAPQASSTTAAPATSTTSTSTTSTSTTTTTTTSTTTTTTSTTTTTTTTVARLAATPTSTSTPTSTTSTTQMGPPPAPLSDAAVSSILDGLAKTSESTTVALLNALLGLQDFGFTPDAAVAAGFGRFPVAGRAYYRDDFGDPRSTPEPHSHKGTDIFAAFDTPVRAPASGEVRLANEPTAGGLAAYVTEADGTWYYLAHLKRFADNLSSGATVKAGDVVGYVGDTGNAAGGAPHVHFEVHPKGGAAVNPKYLLDGWLADALAAVPQLLAPLRQGVTRPLTNVGLVRRFDQGMQAGPSRLLAAAVDPPGAVPTDQRLAQALLAPITPPVLRSNDQAGRL